MKVLAWSLSFLVLILLASPVALLKGCGAELCGGCPADSIAPANSSATIVSGLSDIDIASSAGGACSNALTFVFKDSRGNVLNGICVEIFTNGFIKLSSAPGDCAEPAGYVSGYIRTRTDAGGTVTVDFSSGPLSCGVSGDVKYSFFVQVSSCTVGASSVATWTLNCG